MHALRSAYHSLKRNLPYLFVYQQNQITHNTTPNTTNKLEGLFGNLKQSLRCHQGLAKKKNRSLLRVSCKIMLSLISRKIPTLLCIISLIC